MSCDHEISSNPKGAKIVAWDINEAGLAKTKQLVEATGGRCFTYKVDVSNRQRIYETADRVKQEAGTVYMVVNNAGIVSGKDFLELTDEAIERTMNVNTMAHFWMYRAFLPGMVKRNHGHLVSISSLAGECPEWPAVSLFCSRMLLSTFLSTLLSTVLSTVLQTAKQTNELISFRSHRNQELAV